MAGTLAARVVVSSICTRLLHSTRASRSIDRPIAGTIERARPVLPSNRFDRPIPINHSIDPTHTLQTHEHTSIISLSDKPGQEIGTLGSTTQDVFAGVVALSRATGSSPPRLTATWGDRHRGHPPLIFHLPPRARRSQGTVKSPRVNNRGGDGMGGPGWIRAVGAGGVVQAGGGARQHARTHSRLRRRRYPKAPTLASRGAAWCLFRTDKD